MRKISIPSKLNHKTQTHARVCKEDKKEKELEEKTTACYFAVKGLTLEGCRRIVMLYTD